MKNSKETIVIKAYEFLKHAVPLINRLPKNQRFIFGDRLQNHLMDLQERLIEAVYAPRNQKIQTLREVNLILEKIRLLNRLGRDLHYFSQKQFIELMKRTDELGRMTGGWIRALN